MGSKTQARSDSLTEGETELVHCKLTATVNVLRDDLVELRKAVLLSHGVLYGRLGEEASIAIRNHTRLLLEAGRLE